jgi:DNA helicase HerA-like ATPase
LIYWVLDEDKAGHDIDALRSRIISEANSSGLVHYHQRPAIARAVLSPSLTLLDQKDKTPLTPGLLFAPGTVSVIDYQGLDQNKKRVVAVYLLQMLSRFKMDTPNYDPGVVLVIDEAELLFPANPSKGDKDYVLRIESRIEDITNRGRKRKYGVILVTHLPSEVSQKVAELANTKIAFGCSGANRWIRDNFGKEYVSEINSLPTGICRIKVNVDTINQGPINARIRVPFVGRAEKERA